MCSAKVMGHSGYPYCLSTLSTLLTGQCAVHKVQGYSCCAYTWSHPVIRLCVWTYWGEPERAPHVRVVQRACLYIYILYYYIRQHTSCPLTVNLHTPSLSYIHSPLTYQALPKRNSLQSLDSQVKRYAKRTRLHAISQLHFAISLSLL